MVAGYLVCSGICSESVDSSEGAFAVDIIEEGCTQHSSTYAGGMQLVSAFRHVDATCQEVQI